MFESGVIVATHLPADLPLSPLHVYGPGRVCEKFVAGAGSAFPVLLFLFFCSCKPSSAPLSPKLGEEFSMKVGQQAAIEGGRATLVVDSVIEGRCPVDARCDAPGSADVFCRLSGVPFTLGIYIAAVDTMLSDYQVQLTSVEPWPTTLWRPAQEDYVIKFIVTMN